MKTRGRSDEQKILFDSYVALSTVQRYFSLSKIDAEDVFVKAKELDDSKGYIELYKRRVRAEAVFEVLGLDFHLALKRYAIKNKGEIK